MCACAYIISIRLSSLEVNRTGAESGIRGLFFISLDSSSDNLLMEPAQIQPSSKEHPNATYSMNHDHINGRPAINSGPPLGSTEVYTEIGPYIPQELVFGRSPVPTAVDVHAVCDDEMTEEETLWLIPIQETVLHY